MAELDNLSIQITASTKQASDSIDRLIATLGKLSGALNISGVESFANSMSKLATSINSIEGDSLKSVVKSAKSLSSISAGASKAGDAVTRLGKKLASDIDIKDKQGIAELTRSLREFYSSTTASGMSAANDKIMKIATSFGTISGEVSAARRQALDFIAALDKMKVSLPMDWTKEYGDTGYGKTLRGMVGIKNTVTSGGTNASEAASRLGLGEFGGRDQDAFKAIAEAANNARMVIADTQDEIMSLGEALRSNGEAGIEAAQAMRAFNEQIATAVGMSTQQLGDAMFGNGYLGEETQAQSAAIQNFITMSERLMSQGNPFQNVTDGLMELSNINLSEETVTNLNNLSVAVSKIGGKSGASAGPAMREIASGLQALNVPVPKIGDDLAALAVGLRALGSGNIVAASKSLPFLAEGIRQLNAVKITADVGAIAGLAEAIKQFGYAKVDKSIVNLPVLATELNKLITTLSKAPQVSQNTIELVKALGNLNVNARALSPATTRAGKSLDLFSHHAKRAHKASFSLASAIGKIYATYWGLFRIFGMFKKSITLASDLTEVQNVVDQTFGEMKDRMEDFAKSAVETVGMSELTAKQIGSRFQAMGRNMGISQKMIEGTNDFLQATTKMADGSEKAYADVAHSMADVSINLTRLAGDMASFYNEDYDVVAEKLNAVFTGQTRPLRAYGLDLTQATLQEWALANGMDVNIKKMTQAEKTLLRYQYVMANTTAAHGDFERTIGTWANQTKLAGENLKRLQIILGQIGIHSFKPLVANFNTAMNDIIHLAESTLNSLGTIFGWQVEISDVGIVDDLADGLGDVEDGFDGAGKEAKKFKNFLLGIDELNLLPDNSDKDKGSGIGDALGASASGIQDSLVNMRDAEKGYESIYDTLFKLGRRIGEVELEWLKDIDWDSVFNKAQGAGKGLASFLNGYLADAELFYHRGRFIANGINAIAHAIYGFFHEFDGYQLGKDLGFLINGFTQSIDFDTLNKGGYEMAHDIAETVNGFFENVNWKKVGKTIVEGFNVAVRFVSTIWNEIHWDIIGQSLGDTLNSLFENWDYEEMARLFHGKIQALFDLANNFLSSSDFEMIGEKIGKFLSEMHLEDFADDLAALLWNLLKAAFNLLPTMFEEAPLETALLLGIAGFKFPGFGKALGGTLGSSVSASFSPQLAKFLTTDVTKLCTHSGLLGAAEVLGTSIGAGIVGAIAAYVGYNLGIELGKKLNPDDEMWYTQDAAGEAVSNIGSWFGAIKEWSGSNRSDFGYFQDDKMSSIYPYFQKLLKAGDTDTWGDVKQNLRTGKTYLTDSDLEKIKKFMEDSGVSASEINNMMNQLKDARDAYTNGFKIWMQDNAGLLEREGISVDEAYNRYTSALNEQAEITRKMEELANNPISRYNDAKQIIDLPKPDVLDNTKKSFSKMASAVGSFGKESASAIGSAISDMFRFSIALDDLGSTHSSVMDEMSNALGGFDASGSGAWIGEARNIENLNTKLLTTQTGLERIIAAVDEIGNRKDKTNSLKDSFDGVKGKVEEIGTLFSFDNMSNMFSAIPNAFLFAWKDALNVMKIMWTEIANWINANAKIEIPKTKIGKNEIGGGTVQLRIPRFDVGGSIPNDGSLFFANEKGPEVMANMGSSTGIMNTDQMETAIANGMMRAIANGGMNVTVVLEGDTASLFTAMVKENDNAIRRTNSSPLRR